MGRQPLEYEQHQLYIKLKETSNSDGTIANIDDIVASLPYTRKKVYEYLRQLKMLGYDEERICSCGGKLTKVLHAPAISFKGDGFYKTDK